ncbi:hypothetical protein [Piscinibacter sp. XHJ-5]|uniref:hypothetical protein n=1 Tax=Piscinibacter sp. XHJ-5 TaxID=3037797 RepID=UPI002452A5D1|nr:hypothetical protein [Piscinibacter sp. XHJ-5]
MKILQLVLALPFLLAIGVAAHALLARTVKAVLWAWSPLATGEPEAATYERRVYHTSDRRMLEIIGVAAAAGLVMWLALLLEWPWLWAAGLLVLGGAVLLDVLRWERVAASAHNLWFQRGYRSTVRQVALENIRDVSVEESEAGGFTLRHGRRNRLVRLSVRMVDKRVVALPKTDAHRGLDAVEAVANHLRMRMQHLRDRDRARSANPAAAEPAKAQEAELRRALRKLRQSAAQRSPGRVVS